MRKSRAIILGLFVLFSCTPKKHSNRESSSDGELVPDYQSATLNPRITDSLRAFMQFDSCQNCLHEMFIDKIRPDYSIITIKSRPYSTEYLTGKRPLFKTRVDNVDFFIYSGMEDYISVKLDKAAFAGLDSNSNNYKIWSLHLKNDSAWWNKNEEIPFFPEEPARAH